MTRVLHGPHWRVLDWRLESIGPHVASSSSSAWCSARAASRAPDGPYRGGHGYIQPCDGIAEPLYTSTGARLFSAAATVEALRGREYLKPLGGGSYRIVFPAVVASRERVSQDQKFRFDHLSLAGM